MEVKKKICKGNGKAKGHGCNNLLILHRYGLCKKCFGLWLYTSDEGKKVLNKSIIQGSRRVKTEAKKDNRRKKEELKVNSKKFNLYKTTAWKWCSRYVLLYYADSNGVVMCSTSPELVYHVTDKNIHCGHYIKANDANSSNNSTVLLFENLAPQSSRDNTMHGGKPDVMKNWLIERHGVDKINELARIKRQAYKLDKYTLFEISEKYKKLFKELLIKRNISDPWSN